MTNTQKKILKDLVYEKYISEAIQKQDIRPLVYKAIKTFVASTEFVKFINKSVRVNLMQMIFEEDILESLPQREQDRIRKTMARSVLK